MEAEVELHTFLNPAVDEAEWIPSSGRFNRRGKNNRYY